MANRHKFMENPNIPRKVKQSQRHSIEFIGEVTFRNSMRICFELKILLYKANLYLFITIMRFGFNCLKCWHECGKHVHIKIT